MVTDQDIRQSHTFVMHCTHYLLQPLRELMRYRMEKPCRVEMTANIRSVVRHPAVWLIYFHFRNQRDNLEYASVQNRGVNEILGQSKKFCTIEMAQSQNQTVCCNAESIDSESFSYRTGDLIVLIGGFHSTLLVLQVLFMIFSVVQT